MMKYNQLIKNNLPIGKPAVANWKTSKLTFGELANLKNQMRKTANHSLFRFAKDSAFKNQVCQWRIPRFSHVCGLFNLFYNEHLPPLGGERTLLGISLCPLVGRFTELAFKEIKHG